MKYLHVLPPYSTNPYTFIRFIKDNFSEKDHSFLIMSSLDWCIKNNNRLLAFPDIIYLPKGKNTRYFRFLRIRYCIHLLNQAQHIIWHSYFPLKGIQMLYFFTRKNILQKSVWIEHSLDLYNWSWRPKNLKSYLLKKLHFRMRGKVPCVGLTVLSDQEEWKRQFGDNTVFFETPSPLLSQHLEELKYYLHHPQKHQKPVFMIGYDWLSYNEHKEIAKLLLPFAEEEFSILLPMNFAMPYEYGHKATRKYRIEVRNFIEKTLSRRVSLLTRSAVPSQSYFRTIGAVDIAIFSGERPIKFDLLFYLLLMGKKVFLPASKPLFHYFKECGISIYDTDSIPQMTYQEFISPPTSSSFDWVIDRTFGKGIVEQWSNLFEYLRGKE